jgi:hypothetical protein
MRSPLNLASRPVRNERLPALLFVLATVLLVGVTIHHALILRRLWPTRSAALAQEVVRLGGEMKNLEAQSARMKSAPVSPAQNAEWRIVRELVDRRTFWWSELFASFEEVLPPEVRIVSVAPRVREGRYQVDLVARLANPQAGLNFVKVLEDRPEFESVFPRDCGEQQGEFECRYEMIYLGRGTEPKPGAGPPGASLAALAPAVADGGKR